MESIFKLNKMFKAIYAMVSQQRCTYVHLWSILDKNVLPESIHVEVIYINPDYETFYKTNYKTQYQCVTFKKVTGGRSGLKEITKCNGLSLIIF